jgi:outer membrane immunogenic protein
MIPTKGKNAAMAAVAAWLLMSAGAAAVEDIPGEAPVFRAPVPAADWTGFYLGAGVGFRAADTGVNVNSAQNTDSPPSMVDQFRLAGCFAGLSCIRGQQLGGTSFRFSPYLGYNWQTNSRWVLGIEADAGFGSQTTTSSGYYPATPFLKDFLSTSNTFSVKTTWDASLRGRVGYLVQPNVMIYGTGGPAWLQVESTSNCSTLLSPKTGYGDCASSAFFTGFSPASITHARTKLGATVGAGMEAMLSPNWIARAEYRYSDYGTINNTDVRTDPAGVQTVNYDLKIKTHAATFGLAYKFGDAPNTISELSAYGAIPAVTSWTGAYLGAGVGVRASQTTATLESYVWAPVGYPSLDTATGCGCFLDSAMNGTSFRFNPFLGYNWQFATQWVAGIEGDFAWANHKSTVSGSSEPGAAVYGSSRGLRDSYSIATKWDASVRLRLGYVVNPSLMIYGTAGPAWMKIEATSRCDSIFQVITTAPGYTTFEVGNCIPGLLAPANITQSTIKPGFTIGGGGEARLWSNWVARGEYRYSDFGTAKFTDARSCAGTATFGSYTMSCFGTDVGRNAIRLRTHAAMFGVAYKFD